MLFVLAFLVALAVVEHVAFVSATADDVMISSIFWVLELFAVFDKSVALSDTLGFVLHTAAGIDTAVVGVALSMLG